MTARPQADAEPRTSNEVASASSPERTRRRRVREWARCSVPPLIVLAASAHAALRGWGRWGDFVIDTGRELEWPRRILEGERLYSQLRFYYGPLAPHVNAWLYGLFGVRLEVLAAAGAVTGAATALVVYSVARAFTARFGATLVALSFVYACAFQHLAPTGIFNYVLPYAFAATYGMLAALLSLWTLLRYLAEERRAWFVASLGFLALASLAKLETFVPVLVLHGLFFLSTAVEGRRPLRHAIGYAAAAVLVVAVYGAFYVDAGAALLRDNLGGALNRGSRRFITSIMGLGSPGLALHGLASSALVIAGAAAIASGAAAIVRVPRLARVVRWAALGVAVALIVAPIAFLNPDRLFRILPPLASVAACWWAWRWWRAPERRREALPHLLLSAFAAAAALRIFFSATPAHYGFYMLAPSVAWLSVAWFEYLPRAIGAGTPPTRAAFAACGAALILGNTWVVNRMTEASLAAKTLPLRSKRGTLWVEPVQAGAIPILRAIARSPPDTRVLIAPNVTVINFLTGRAGALDGMSSYLPMDFTGGYEDAAVIARWERDPPDLVLWSRGPLGEFGDEELGRTYGVEAFRWILSHYEPVGDPASHDVLMRRRRAGLAP